MFKSVIDVTAALVALPIVGLLAVVLLILNPIFNPGPLFFRQDRMGLGGRTFGMWKFRTMTPCETGLRRHGEPVEEHRITPLGRILRRLRIDELPNFFNVLAGEMSLVGPRPDAAAHAEHFVQEIPYYLDRFRVKPGITGLAQIRMGYAADEGEVRKKARYDRLYVRKSCGRMDLFVIAATFAVMITGFGAR
ncbi:MAG: sugar transferase [Paracoccaceae bacterium]|nr:sugar transferase [Paracoccaceae bacterium]